MKENKNLAKKEVSKEIFLQKPLSWHEIEDDNWNTFRQLPFLEKEKLPEGWEIKIKDRCGLVDLFIKMNLQNGSAILFIEERTHTSYWKTWPNSVRYMNLRNLQISKHKVFYEPDSLTYKLSTNFTTFEELDEKIKQLKKFIKEMSEAFNNGTAQKYKKHYKKYEEAIKKIVEQNIL